MTTQTAVAERISKPFPGRTLLWETRSSPKASNPRLFWSVEPTVAGPLFLLSDSTGVIEASFTEDPEKKLERLHSTYPDHSLSPDSRNWLDALETLSESDPPPIPLSLYGTPFQLDVWRTLLSIPWGETRTYGWIAKTIGRPKAHRAVGSAVGSNPIALLVPCHRVLPANGTLGNYGGGVERKAALLEWEGARDQTRR